MPKIPFGVSDFLAEQIGREIAEHPHWCSEQCSFFVPDDYVSARLEQRLTKDQVQNNFELCHFWY